MHAAGSLVRQLMSTLFSAVSLLLCAAVCVLWMRSYSTAYGIIRGVPGDRVILASDGGYINLSTIEVEDTAAPLHAPTPPIEGKFVRQPVPPITAADNDPSGWFGKYGYASGGYAKGME